jgi:hypothetical protein
MCAAVLHIEREKDSTMIFTAVPLVGRDPAQSAGAGTDGIFKFGEGAVIEVWPPAMIQIEPERWPVSEELEGVETKPVEYSREASEEAAEAEKTKGKADPKK